MVNVGDENTHAFDKLATSGSELQDCEAKGNPNERKKNSNESATEFGGPKSTAFNRQSVSEIGFVAVEILFEANPDANSGVENHADKADDDEIIKDSMKQRKEGGAGDRFADNVAGVTEFKNCVVGSEVMQKDAEQETNGVDSDGFEDGFEIELD